MERAHLSELVHRLNDVELGVLLCLVADGHCILTTDPENLFSLEQDVEQIATQVFGLNSVTVQCSTETTLDVFVGSLLVEEGRRASPLLSSDISESHSPFRTTSTITDSDPFLGGRKRIANVIVIRDLDSASLQVQTQVLEIMRTRRIVTQKSVLEAPERFLVLALLPKTGVRPALMSHLREEFFISHHHASTAEDVEPLDELEPGASTTTSSASSFASVVIHKQPPTPSLQTSFPFYTPHATTTIIPHAAITHIRLFAADVSISTEIRRYLLDIIVFLRMHRAVRSGSVTSLATSHFENLVRCLAPLHDFDFATPALVGLAMFKVYAHRVELLHNADGDRSMLYGSERGDVERYLEQVDVEAVIEDVLASVRAPL